MPDDRKQWFLLWLIALWLLLSFVAPIAAFRLTSNPLSFTVYVGIVPPARLLYLLVNRIYPPGDNETKITLAKQRKKGRVP